MKARIVCCLLLLVALALPTDLFAQNQGWIAYEINAQYRGTVKKGFENLGGGMAQYIDLGGGKRQVVMRGCAAHPEKKNTFYSYRLNMGYAIEGSAVKTFSEGDATFQNFDVDEQRNLKNMIILVSMVQTGEVLPLLKGPFTINGSTIEITGQLAKKGKNSELTLTHKGKPEMEGKFFLDEVAPGKYSISKFRLKRGKLVMSFVSVPTDKLVAEYKAKNPFNQILFAQ
ncbi:MAG TPA: hypothetical protein PKO06_14560 [Candidatus Ozemobacteraceae bacterium]|nr:hypothetical protein [Candidatus Ozemobacteraceae bacterium]